MGRAAEKRLAAVIASSDIASIKRLRFGLRPFSLVDTREVALSNRPDIQLGVPLQPPHYAPPNLFHLEHVEPLALVLREDRVQRHGQDMSIALPESLGDMFGSPLKVSGMQRASEPVALMASGQDIPTEAVRDWREVFVGVRPLAAIDAVAALDADAQAVMFMPVHVRVMSRVQRQVNTHKSGLALSYDQLDRCRRTCDTLVLWREAPRNKD